MAANNHLTPDELARRKQIARELAEFASDDYPWWQGLTEWNGVDGGMCPDGTVQRCIT